VIVYGYRRCGSGVSRCGANHDLCDSLNLDDRLNAVRAVTADCSLPVECAPLLF
jgi:hypothetical protein